MTGSVHASKLRESPPRPGWLKTADAAERLGLSVSTVQRLRRAGGLDAQKLGPEWWISEPSVTRVAADRRTWVSHATAAALTGIPTSTLTAPVGRGELHPRSVHRSLPSLDRDEVLTWAEERRRRKRRAETKRLERLASVGPPDDGCVWLDAETVALPLNVSACWVRAMAKADRLPRVRRGRRLWFLREHMEHASAARALWRAHTQVVDLDSRVEHGRRLTRVTSLLHPAE